MQKYCMFIVEHVKWRMLLYLAEMIGSYLMVVLFSCLVIIYVLMVLWRPATCYQKDSLIVLLMRSLADITDLWRPRYQVAKTNRYIAILEMLQLDFTQSHIRVCLCWFHPRHGVMGFVIQRWLHHKAWTTDLCNWRPKYQLCFWFAWEWGQLLILTMRALLQLRGRLQMRHWLGSVTTPSIFLTSCSRWVFWGFWISMYSSMLSLLRSLIIDW